MQDLRGNSTPRAKSAALHRFEHDAACCVLVMDDSGAVGLDLSFVEVVFLMEPLVDTAQEQQIVSRAHRMGATAPVRVEVLVMQARLFERVHSDATAVLFSLPWRLRLGSARHRTRAACHRTRATLARFAVLDQCRFR